MTHLRHTPVFLPLCASLLLAGCGSSAPAPEPVLLSQFKPTTDRFQVISTIGKAEGTVQKDGRACDIYKIYTTGLTSGGRAAMTAGEVVTGIATLGLAEVVWAPVKAGTRPQQHTVLFCFGADDKLVDIYDKDPTDSTSPDHLIVNRIAYAQSLTQAQAPTEVAAAPATSQPLAPSPVTPGTDTAVSPTAEPARDAGSNVPVIYEKPVAAKEAAPAGTISLNNVSQEATTGRAQINPGAGAVPDTASTDDLNALSERKSATANKPAFSLPVPAAPSARLQDASQ